ncbi:hypothetical protein EPUS_08741 [Endocarpon pusillum Z07020]|uniref:Uncharacterized protein n=1 Tax=Endocarpon pusillum (strain Z07020 / HMAS-L-300199) TaxID=1263415 RepID=U1HQB2_ENDPU|nr:uncharacterized protein EPUS_08741 [Endocarpon pusillum Z07020]ERF72605.1 hypothetical protein EPUS_08741 [Endocarpon pusillum Z07020]
MSALMFPEAPAPTVPITLVEDTDLDCLLVEFPNHLIIHTVMEHFCAPSARHPTNRGYVAKEMAQRLSVHNNAVNGLDMDAADRIDNLVDWIRKLKKSANVARRKRQAAGQTVELVPFEGQCLRPGLEDEQNVDEADDNGNSGAPTLLGLRLKQQADEALADLTKMRVNKARSDAEHDGDAVSPSVKKN